MLENVTERVRASIAICIGVGGVSDSDTVEYDNERAHCGYTPIGCQAVFISTVSRIQ